MCREGIIYKRKRKEWGGGGGGVVTVETGVCGLLVKVLFVGAVYDTFLVGCTSCDPGRLMVTGKKVEALLSQTVFPYDIIICLISARFKVIYLS